MSKPKISVIIALAPYRDAEVLSSFENLNFSKKGYEIIIERGYNPSRNRNKAIARAKGEILAIIDDDALLDADLFRNALNFFEMHPEIDIVGGPQLTPDSDGYFAKVSGLAIGSFFGSHNMRARYVRAPLNLDANENHLTTAIVFIRKKVFDKIEGFNESLWPGEDPEFFARAKMNGIRIAYSPDLVVYHRRRPDIYSFAKQFYKYGATRLKKEAVNRTTVDFLFLIPSVFFLYVLALPALVLVSDLFYFLILTYFAAAFAASVYAAAKGRILSAVLVLPFIYFVQHMSYGAGMIRSLFGGKK